MAKRSSAEHSFMRLGALDAQSGDINVIIETPKGSRNKFKYDPEQHLFKLSGVLPAGAVFPFDFGFIPSIPVGRTSATAAMKPESSSTAKSAFAIGVSRGTPRYGACPATASISSWG